MNVGLFKLDLANGLLPLLFGLNNRKLGLLVFGTAYAGTSNQRGLGF